MRRVLVLLGLVALTAAVVAAVRRRQGLLVAEPGEPPTGGNGERPADRQEGLRAFVEAGERSRNEPAEPAQP